MGVMGVSVNFVTGLILFSLKIVIDHGVDYTSIFIAKEGRRSFSGVSDFFEALNSRLDLCTK